MKLLLLVFPTTYFPEQDFCQAAYCICVTNTAIALTWTRLGKNHAT